MYKRFNISYTFPIHKYSINLKRPRLRQGHWLTVRSQSHASDTQHCQLILATSVSSNSFICAQLPGVAWIVSFLLSNYTLLPFLLACCFSPLSIRFSFEVSVFFIRFFDLICVLSSATGCTRMRWFSIYVLNVIWQNNSTFAYLNVYDSYKYNSLSVPIVYYPLIL